MKFWNCWKMLISIFRSIKKCQFRSIWSFFRSIWSFFRSNWSFFRSIKIRSIHHFPFRSDSNTSSSASRLTSGRSRRTILSEIIFWRLTAGLLRRIGKRLLLRFPSPDFPICRSTNRRFNKRRRRRVLMERAVANVVDVRYYKYW